MGSQVNDPGEDPAEPTPGWVEELRRVSYKVFFRKGWRARQHVVGNGLTSPRHPSLAPRLRDTSTADLVTGKLVTIGVPSARGVLTWRESRDDADKLEPIFCYEVRLFEHMEKGPVIPLLSIEDLMSWMVVPYGVDAVVFQDSFSSPMLFKYEWPVKQVKGMAVPACPIPLAVCSVRSCLSSWRSRCLHASCLSARLPQPPVCVQSQC